MKISIGQVFANKTLKYVLPLLRKHYDDVLITMVNSVSVLAVGIGDFVIQEQHNQHIFILVDSKVNARIFYELIGYIMDKEYFMNTYAYDNALTGRMQMIVFKLPENVMNKFMNGEYSKMYSFEDACDLIKHENVFDVIVKNPKHKPKFIDEVEVEYGYRLKVCGELDEVGDRELDIPPEKKNEIFNYREPLF